MNKYFITFGQSHAHRVSGKTFDKDCWVEVEAEDHWAAQELADTAFGSEYSMVYDKETFAPEYYSRGGFKL